MAQSRAKRVRELSGGGAARRADRADDRGTRAQGRHGEAFQGRGDAFRAIYAVQIGSAVWVIDAFQKKSKTGIKTPKVDVDRIKERLKRLKEALR